MGSCCSVRRNEELYPLTDTKTKDLITYESAGKGYETTKLLIDSSKLKKYDSCVGIKANQIVQEQNELYDEIELNLSLRNIPQRKMLSCPCDPFIIVCLKDEVNNVYNIIGQTELLSDNPNADFSKIIRLEYQFEQVQKIQLLVYDANEEGSCDDDDDDELEIKTKEDLSKHDFVGAVEFIVGDLITANGQKLVMAIEDKKGNKLAKSKYTNNLQPIVIIRSQEVNSNIDEIDFLFSSIDLPKMKACCGRINPFFIVYRQTGTNEWASVYKSEHMLNTYSPNWKAFKLSSRRLCDGDIEKPILIKIYDWNKDALPVFACEIKTCLAQLCDTRSLRFATKNINAQLIIKECRILKKYPFLSYLKGGLEMHFMTAIDFTGSNGNPNDEKSLHYMGPPHFESQYLKVIKSVGRVLAPYDIDGTINAYGFGANLTPFNRNNKQLISHCFNLTYPSRQNKVNGIEGLIEAYKNCLDKVELYGPTYLSEIIQTISAQSRGICTQNKQSYNILLIITDGVINDMNKTINSIVDATVLPLSIIIVGVGDADFDNMESLDADDVPLTNSITRKIAKRCIVQFVEFNEFKDKHISAIAKKTLEEIPEQVSTFMSMYDIHPNKPNNDMDDQYDIENVATAPILDNN